jgi:hypothetical protein
VGLKTNWRKAGRGSAIQAECESTVSPVGSISPIADALAMPAISPREEHRSFSVPRPQILRATQAIRVSVAKGKLKLSELAVQLHLR